MDIERLEIDVRLNRVENSLQLTNNRLEHIESRYRGNYPDIFNPPRPGMLIPCAPKEEIKSDEGVAFAAGVIFGAIFTIGVSVILKLLLF